MKSSSSEAEPHLAVSAIPKKPHLRAGAHVGAVVAHGRQHAPDNPCPPLIPLIHGDLRMSETEVGILAGLPVALFAAAAIPGSLLVARLGAAGAVTAGLVITGFGAWDLSGLPASRAPTLGVSRKRVPG
jgi:hypothetical protein